MCDCAMRKRIANARDKMMCALRGAVLSRLIEQETSGVQEAGECCAKRRTLALGSLLFSVSAQLSRQQATRSQSQQSQVPQQGYLVSNILGCQPSRLLPVCAQAPLLLLGALVRACDFQSGSALRVHSIDVATHTLFLIFVTAQFSDRHRGQLAIREGLLLPSILKSVSTCQIY